MTVEGAAIERKAYTAKEVAQMLGISTSGVYKMIDRGLLRAVLIGSKEKRIPKQALEEYLSGKTTSSEERR